jgi:PAS domain-containing protein
MDPETVQKIGKPVFGGAIFRTMMGERKPQKAFNPQGEPDGLSLPAYHPPVQSFLGVPPKAGDNLHVWIYVAQKLSKRAFTDEDEDILVTLAAQAGLAFDNLLHLQQLKQHAAELEAEVAERKRAESKFRRLIETAPMGIVIANKKGIVAELNAQTLTMFGYERQEIVGQPDSRGFERGRRKHRRANDSGSASSGHQMSGDSS